MVLGLTQPLTEISTRNIFFFFFGRCVGLTTLPFSCADCLEIWEPQPPGTLRISPGLQCDCFAFTFALVMGLLYLYLCPSYEIALPLPLP
jgi:hypothetical protein